MSLVKYELGSVRSVWFDPEEVPMAVQLAIDGLYRQRTAYVARGPDTDITLAVNVPTYLADLQVADDFEGGVVSVRFQLTPSPPAPPDVVTVNVTTLLDRSDWLGDHTARTVKALTNQQVFGEEVLPIDEGFHTFDLLVELTATSTAVLVANSCRLTVAQL